MWIQTGVLTGHVCSLTPPNGLLVGSNNLDQLNLNRLTAARVCPTFVFLTTGASSSMFNSTGGLAGCSFICFCCHCNLEAAIAGHVAVLFLWRLGSLAAGFCPIGARCSLFLSACGLAGCYLISNLCYHRTLNFLYADFKSGGA